MNLGKTIKLLRKNRNLKQSDLAKKLDITTTGLSLIENGHVKPSKNRIVKICEVFDIPETFLMFLSVDENDLSKEKRTAFKILEPGLKKHILDLFAE